MKLAVLDAAEAEIAETVAFYEGRAVGLGEEFLVELWRIFGLIENAPETWPQLDEKVRRCRLGRFPFGVYYRIDPDRIVVFAVMHGRRRPGAWKKRR